MISPDDLLAIECDVLIPAALGGMIHEHNADRINTKMIIEGANSPTTPVADEILHEKGIHIIPDVMANAGGVVGSYFEWVQNLQHFRWSEREVNDKLGGIMRRAYRDVSARAKEERISLREARLPAGNRESGRGEPHARVCVRARDQRDPTSPYSSSKSKSFGGPFSNHRPSSPSSSS